MDHISTIQAINTVLNLFGVMGLMILTVIIWKYRKKQRERYDLINKRLDHILVLSNEVYQTEVKDRKKLLDREAEATQIISGKTGPKNNSRVRL